MTKAQVLNFTTADVCELLENTISQPMYTAQNGKLAWPEQKDEQQRVIFFQSAASYIAYRVTEGSSVNKAQNEWLSLASIINDEHKKNRRKVRLVDADFMLRDRSEFEKFLSEQDIVFSDAMLKSEDLDLAFPTLEYIAARLRVLAFEELHELDIILRAASLPATDEDGPVNIESAIQQFKDQYERQAVALEEAEERLGVLMQKQAEFEAELEEKELILLQLKQVQEELEANHLRCKEIERAAQTNLSAHEQREDELKSQLASAKAQLEKVTAEAKEYRETLDAQAHEQALVELQEDNELLLLQIQQLQEELEKYYLRAKELEALNLKSKGSNQELSSLNDKIKKLEKIISEKNQKLHSFSQKNKVLKLDNDKLRFEIEELESRHLINRVGTPNLPAVIPQGKMTKHRVPSRFLKLIKRPFVGKPEPKTQREFKRQKQLIMDSGLFDEEFYLKSYPDVALSSLEPVEHYLKFGGFEGRKPNEKFDSAFYLRKYKDVRDESVNPLVHFIQYGVHEKRLTRKGR